MNACNHVSNDVSNTPRPNINQNQNSVESDNKLKFGENSPKRIPLKELLTTELPQNDSSDDDEQIQENWEELFSEEDIIDAEKLDAERINVIPILTQRSAEEVKKAFNIDKSSEKNESQNVMPKQKFADSNEFDHLHTLRDHILFLTDMIPNLRFNGYNREKLIRDQYKCPELQTAMNIEKTSPILS